MVRVWDARTGHENLTLKEHTNVWSVAFSPDGQRLASAGSDSVVRVWDSRTGRESLVLRGHTDCVRGLGFSADSQRLASAGDDVLAADALLEVLLNLAAYPVPVMLGVALAATVGQPGAAGDGHQCVIGSEKWT